MKKLLFVCSGNKLRSPTAEYHFSKKGYDTRSVGTSKNAVNVVTAEYLRWADKIIVMEEKHKQRIMAYFPRIAQYKEIEVLNIPDDFKYMDDKLIKILDEFKF